MLWLTSDNKLEQEGTWSAREVRGLTQEAFVCVERMSIEWIKCPHLLYTSGTFN